METGTPFDAAAYREYPKHAAGYSELFNLSLRFANIVLLTVAALLLTCGVGRAQSTPDWSGRWETFWRDGAAVIVLQQDGAQVTGTYEPGGGRIEGQLEGQVLRGRWSVDGVSGNLIFALSDDNQTFTGRFDSGEYWNGRRSQTTDLGNPLIERDSSPRGTLQSLVASINEFLVRGDVDALRFAQTLLVFEGDEENSRVLNRRRALLWDIIDLSTFRVYDAPPRPAGDTASFRIGLDGFDTTYDLRFVRNEAGGWRLLVEDEATLSATLRRYLEALDMTSVAAAKVAMERSPRGVVQRFFLGVSDWDGAGREQALSTLDLSLVPARLRYAEGLLLADYLKNVLDRAGLIFLQEVPNNPNRTIPYVHYAHPAGNVIIARAPALEEDAPDRWAFDAATMSNLPALYSAMQHLPLAEGVRHGKPLTQFFALRERVREVSPNLLKRTSLLENWQWLAIVSLFVLVFVLFAISRRVFGKAMPEDVVGADAAPPRHRGLIPAIRLTLGSLVLAWGFREIGLVETPLAVLDKIASALTAIGAISLAFVAIGSIGAVFQRKAAATVGYADEIVTAMAIGVIKLGILAAGLLYLANMVDLPYEGVLAALGVGGLALAFAARETVSNVLGGILLLTDRRARWLETAQLAGRLDLSDPAAARMVQWIPPRWDWVDPLKDIQAQVLAMEAGITSRRKVVEATGYDVEEVDRENATDTARAEALGLRYRTNPGETQGARATPARRPAPRDGDDGEEDAGVTTPDNTEQE